MGDALHVNGGVTDAREARLAQQGFIAPSSSGVARLGVRAGVLPGLGSNSLVVGTSSTAPMRYLVARHHHVATRDAEASGAYLGCLDSDALADTTAAPASNSRIDVIWVKQNDSTPGITTPDGSTGQVVGVTQGAAAAAPVKPAIPVGAVELGTAVVFAGATRTDTGTGSSGVSISQTAVHTVARGGVRPVLPTTTAAIAEVGSYVGEVRYVPGAWQPLQIWDGALWTPAGGRRRKIVANFTTDANGAFAWIFPAAQDGPFPSLLTEACANDARPAAQAGLAGFKWSEVDSSTSRAAFIAYGSDGNKLTNFPVRAVVQAWGV